MERPEDIYKQELEALEEEKRQAWNNKIFKLTLKLQQHPFFGKSQPKIDFDFVAELVRVYGYENLRQELNKMHIWLKANPHRAKKNYRRFIVNWMNRSSLPLVVQVISCSWKIP